MGVPLPEAESAPKREGAGGPMGNEGHEVMQAQVSTLKENLKSQAQATATNAREMRKAQDEYFGTLATTTKSNLDVLKEYQGSQGASNQYPAMVAGFALGLILLLLKIFHVEMSNEDLTSLNNLIQEGIYLFGPIVANWWVHRKVTPVPPMLQGNK